MRTVAWVILVWVALTAFWLLIQGEWNAIQLYAAASAATLSLVVGLGVRRWALPSARVEVRWLRRALWIPWHVVKEFGYVTLFLLRRGEGEFRTVSFPTGGARPAERGRRAFVALATGYSPNSYVVDVDQERGEVLVHLLRSVPPGEELV
jgi:multisubunit Na+/H+ antiporter MnhE subunit